MNRNILYQLFCFIILKKLWNQLLGKKLKEIFILLWEYDNSYHSET